MDETPTSSPGSTPDHAMILQFKNDRLVDPKENTVNVPGKLADLFTPDKKEDQEIVLPFGLKENPAETMRAKWQTKKLIRRTLTHIQKLVDDEKMSTFKIHTE